MWVPHGASRCARSGPDVGAVVAWDYAVWFVLSSRSLPESEWEPWERRVWALDGSPDPWREAPYELVLVPANGGDRVTLTVRQVALRDGRPVYVYDSGIWVYDDPEHYPICACCRGPIPCRVKHAETVAAAAAQQEAALAARATKGAMCCGEEITPGQKVITFPGPNVRAPTAPPPIFHARMSCRDEVRKYEKVWLKANPGGRSRFFCPGKIRWHADGWDCTEQADCRGDDIFHDDRTRCSGKIRSMSDGTLNPCLRCADARAGGWAVPEPEPRRRKPRRDRFADPAPLAGWVIPANKDLDRSFAHAVDPDRPGERLPVVRQWVAVETPPLDGLAGVDPRHGRRPKMKERIRPAREWPAGASRGWAVCGAELLADDLWVRYPGGDPEDDGLACRDCLAVFAKQLA